MPAASQRPSAPPRTPARLAALAATTLVLVAGCGSDDESSSGSGSQANQQTSGSTVSGGTTVSGDETTTTPLPEITTGPRAHDIWVASRDACTESSIPAVYKRYLAAIKKRGAERANVAPGIVEQAQRLPKRARSTIAAAPTAATLYAVSKPRPDRQAAFRGCLRGLQAKAMAEDKAAAEDE